MHRHFVPRQIVVDEEAHPMVHGQFLHQRRPHAHRHCANHLAARRLGVQDAARCAHGQHAPDTRFARVGVDRHFHEVRAERGLLEFLVQVAELHAAFYHQLAVASRLPQQRRPAAVLGHRPVGERRAFRFETQLVQHGRAQLLASRVHAGRGAVRAPLPARTGRHRERRIPQPHHDFRQRHAQHLGGGLRNDGVAARADVGHVGFHDDLARGIQPYPRGGIHHQVVAKCRRYAHAHQPSAFAPCSRLRIARRPAKALGA